MATTRISICLLALFLVASYASATTIQEVCKGTCDPNFCLVMLQKTASPSTDFKSEAWRKQLLDAVLSKAMVAQNFLADGLRKLKGAEAAAFKTCVESMKNSVQFIKESSYDDAGIELANCSDSLEAGGSAPADSSQALDKLMPRVRTLADDASTAAKVANGIITDLNLQNPKPKHRK